MHLRNTRVQPDRSAGIEPGWRRDSAPRLTRAPLALVERQPARRCPASIEPAVDDGRQSVAAQRLVVGWGRRGEAQIIWLSGTLDRVNETTLDGELDARATDAACLVIDLTGLEFIDVCGLDTLARIYRRATEKGDRLSFQHGQHVAQRPLGLIRAAQLRSEWAPRRARRSDEESYFALAMACADVDHPTGGDRPRAA
jgi:anti-anti-sigma factor